MWPAVFHYSEDLTYCQNCESQFTLEEKLESLKWVAANISLFDVGHNPHMPYEIEWRIEELERTIEYRDAEEDYWQEIEAQHC